MHHFRMCELINSKTDNFDLVDEKRPSSYNSVQVPK